MTNGGNLRRAYEDGELAGWPGCSEQDCLPGCRFAEGHCERLAQHLSNRCPKCGRVRNDWDCAEDNCPMAAERSGPGEEPRKSEEDSK